MRNKIKMALYYKREVIFMNKFADSLSLVEKEKGFEGNEHNRLKIK